jgi:hypothetical protein
LESPPFFFRRVGDLLQGLLLLATSGLVVTVLSVKQDVDVMSGANKFNEDRWASQIKFNEQITNRLTVGGCNAARCSAMEAILARLSEDLRDHQKVWAHSGASERHAVATEKRARLSSEINRIASRVERLESMLPSFFKDESLLK